MGHWETNEQMNKNKTCTNEYSLGLGTLGTLYVSKSSVLIAFVTDFVDVVVEEFIDEIDMWEEHSSAAVSGESEGIEYFSDILFFLHLFSSFSHQFAELLPLMCDHFTTTKTTYRDDHLVFF